MAFARLRIFAESPATPWPANAIEHTAFAVRFRTSSAIDLTVPAFEAQAAQWTHPTDYRASQALAEAAREGGVQVVRYRSVRDTRGAAT